MTNQHDFTVPGSRRAEAEQGLAAWVCAFLASDGSDNAALGEKLRDEKQSWIGPIELPFDELNRLAGPPDQPTLDRMDDGDIDTVEAMQEEIDEEWEPAPLVVSVDDGQLKVEDGNHRIEALRRAGRSSYWCVVGFDSQGQRQNFLDRHATESAT